jgi:hypothetical protein
MGCAGEAWIRLACPALPIALAASGGSLASTTWAASFGTLAACRLATRCAAALVAGARPASTLASTTAEAEYDALQGVKAAGKVRVSSAARLPAMAATGHGGSGHSPRPLCGVVPLQEA